MEKCTQEAETTELYLFLSWTCSMQNCKLFLFIFEDHKNLSLSSVLLYGY